MTNFEAAVIALSSLEEGFEISAELAEELVKSRLVCARAFEIDYANLELYTRYYLEVDDSFFVVRALVDHGAERFYAQRIFKAVAREDGAFEDIEEMPFPTSFVF